MDCPRRRSTLLRMLCGLAVLGAMLTAPAAAEARNRTKEELRRSIFGNFSDSQLAGHLVWVARDDAEVAPGVFISVAGYSVGGDGRSESLFTAQIFNESRHSFCMRVRQNMASGPFVGRLALDNSGINILVDAGGKATIATYRAKPAVSGSPDFRTDGFSWTPNLSAPEGRKCSSVEPEELQLFFDTPVGRYGFSFMPELRARLEGRPPPPPYQPGSNRASMALAEQLRRSGVSMDPTGKKLHLGDYGQAVLGPIEVTAAAASSRDRHRALSWLYNGSNLNICAVATPGISVRLEGNLQRDYAPNGGFYLPARSGRALATISGDRFSTSVQGEGNPDNPLNFDPAISVWDAPSGVSSDAGCAASAFAVAALRTVTDRGGFSAYGQIADLMR